MLVDEKLIVGTIDRVVQDGLVKRISTFSTSRSELNRMSELRILAGMASPLLFSSPRSAMFGQSGSASAILTVTPTWPLSARM
ncbi:MAG TPA: hypothetical protein VJ347_19235, partial [Streptosporangiaceae bacterium]|nr:hypothetical protein [Streptosporangiaceae bacterium]